MRPPAPRCCRTSTHQATCRTRINLHSSTLPAAYMLLNVLRQYPPPPPPSAMSTHSHIGGRRGDACRQAFHQSMLDRRRPCASLMGTLYPQCSTPPLKVTRVNTGRTGVGGPASSRCSATHIYAICMCVAGCLIRVAHVQMYTLVTVVRRASIYTMMCVAAVSWVFDASLVLSLLSLSLSLSHSFIVRVQPDANFRRGT